MHNRLHAGFAVLDLNPRLFNLHKYEAPYYTLLEMSVWPTAVLSEFLQHFYPFRLNVDHRWSSLNLNSPVFKTWEAAMIFTMYTAHKSSHMETNPHTHMYIWYHINSYYIYIYIVYTYTIIPTFKCICALIETHVWLYLYTQWLYLFFGIYLAQLQAVEKSTWKGSKFVSCSFKMTGGHRCQRHWGEPFSHLWRRCQGL